MKILVTGSAGFIGFHLAKKLLELKHFVYSIDNINNYYDLKLKKSRLSILKKFDNFNFYKIDLINKNKINKIIKKYDIKIIIHLAAQAGVRYSVDFPEPYFQSNILGFYNILEISKENNIKHLIFASSSSVYGDGKNFPLKESSSTDKPLSFYAATKKSNELMAHAYSNIYKLPTTALRFFTVYGTLGRPDMAIFNFTDSISKSKKIKLFNYGKNSRDLTHIDDIINMLIKIINRPSKKNIPNQTFNLGNGKPITSIEMLNVIEKKIKKKAKKKYIGKQKGDVIKTHSDVSSIKKIVNYKPKIDLDSGIDEFVRWYKLFYL
jgi:UDP-glucuronate 4-epimerase